MGLEAGKVESMKPVMSALDAIAAIQRETREAHVERASTCPTETILSHDGRHGPDAPFAYGEATTQLNRGPGAPPIDHAAPEAGFAWEGKIRIDKRDRIGGAPARNATTIILGALLSALALCIGWIAALNSDFFNGLITSPAFILMKAADRFANPTTAPYQLWQTDFTYLKVIGWGWFYLSTVLDDFSRYILAWKLCTTMSATDVSDTLQVAL